MVTIRIGTDSRSLEDADESWLAQQVDRRHAEGQPVCIDVAIRTPTMDIRLATPACGTGGGGRPPRPEEAEVLELWTKAKLTSDDFSGGNLVEFVKRLRRYL